MSELSLLDQMARTHFPAEPAWQARRALIHLLDDLNHETLRTLRVQRHQEPGVPDAPALEQGTIGALIEDDVRTHPGSTVVDVQARTRTWATSTTCSPTSGRAAGCASGTSTSLPGRTG